MRAQTSDKGPIISVLNRQTSEMQLFDASQDVFGSNTASFPIFRYLLAFEPTQQTMLAHVSDHVLFVLSADTSKNMSKIQIVSRRLSETKATASTNPASPVNSPPVLTTSSSTIVDGFAILDQNANNEAILQEFYLRGADLIRGYLPPLRSTEHSADDARRFDSDDKSHGDSSDRDSMLNIGDGGYFYTKDAIFEIKADVRASLWFNTQTQYLMILFCL